MASAKPAGDPPALNATRQMLDELDALMERMLAVPVNDLEAPPDVPAPSPAPRSRPLAATLTLLPVPVEDPPASQRSHTDPPLAPPASPSSVLDILNAATAATPQRPILPFSTAPRSSASSLPALADAPTVAPRRLSDRAIPATEAPSLDTLMAEIPDPPGSFIRWFILPLLWGNQLFDRGTMLLGEPGARLRSPTGRGALGTLGVVLLGVSLLWLLRDWLGWTW